MAVPSATGPAGPTEPPDVAGRFELAYPGPLRDRLVAAVLDGSKTSTSSLLAEYQGEEDPLPEEGRRYLLVDSAERPVGVVETTEVRLVPLGEVDLPFAREEGEGYESVVEWREAHERFSDRERAECAAGGLHRGRGRALPAGRATGRPGGRWPGAR